ncbi:MAG TPA: DUF2207 domain-containing protein [Vicinamibacterales bacterium]|nr:DUF2207 domain-containing protein [Vicinamibacterales bacterium]
MAAAPGWQIDRFNAILDLDASGAFIAREAIDADFGLLSQPGIVREITAERRVDGDHVRQFPMSLLAINDAQGRPLPVQASQRGALQRFQIGDPRAAVAGKQTYRLAYQVRRALTGSATYDELQWSATGAWPVPIGSTAIVVRPPAGGILEATCAQGAPSSSKEECRASFTDKAATFTSTRSLAAGEELTVDVRFSKRTFPEPQPLVVARAQPPAATPGAGRFALATEAAVLGIVLVIAAAWWRTRRSAR